MKKILATAGCFMIMSTSAFSDTVRGTVEDHFTYVNQSVPTTERVCSNVNVPVYGNSTASTGDALAGAIIGGVIGNQFGNGSGRDAMTVLGAIVGADVANKNGSRQIVGYTTETRCENQTVYINNRQQVYSHSTITFIDNGRTYTVRFQR